MTTPLQNTPMSEEEIQTRLQNKLLSTASGKKRGAKKNQIYLSFEDARECIRGELIPSRGKYQEWWDRNKPKTIPRFPYRVYTKEWISWNDFLGNNNSFNNKIGTKWKTIVEATAVVHKLNLKTSQEWMDWVKVPGNLPADIPARPDLVYSHWTTWGYWLGNTPAQAIEAKKDIAKLQVYYIIHQPDAPQNVLSFGVELMGLRALKERWDRERFDIVKLFWYNNEKSALVNEIVNNLSSPYQGYDVERLVPNMWEIVYHLQTTLPIVTREEMVAVY